MNLDWNWFFSSFCQSAAALIGIIAAFVISRLLGLTEKVNISIAEFDNLVIQFQKIKDSLKKRDFHWHTKILVRYDKKLQESVKRGDFDNLGQSDVLKKIYSLVNISYKIDKAVWEGFVPIFTEYNSHKNETTIAKSLRLISDPGGDEIEIMPLGSQQRLNKENEIINQLDLESNTLIRYFSKNLQDLKSFEGTIKPLRIIVQLLMVSFFFTVIYPLHFMPVDTKQGLVLIFNMADIAKSCFTLKFLMLAIFFGIIEGLFYYFLTLTSELKTKLTKAIEANGVDYKDIKHYSEYFN